MTKARNLFLVLILTAVSVRAEVVSIATARTLPAGTVVTVEGQYEVLIRDRGDIRPAN